MSDEVTIEGRIYDPAADSGEWILRTDDGEAHSIGNLADLVCAKEDDRLRITVERS